jgi:hypothetical protein
MIQTTWLYCTEVATPQGDVTGIDFDVAPFAGETHKATSSEITANPLGNLRSVTAPFLRRSTEN